VHVKWSSDRGHHRHANTQQILEDLHAPVVHLPPERRVGDVAEGREVDTGMSARRFL
jgi:hypothetical protein